MLDNTYKKKSKYCRFLGVYLSTYNKNKLLQTWIQHEKEKTLRDCKKIFQKFTQLKGKNALSKAQRKWNQRGLQFSIFTTLPYSKDKWDKWDCTELPTCTIGNCFLFFYSILFYFLRWQGIGVCWKTEEQKSV